MFETYVFQDILIHRYYKRKVYRTLFSAKFTTKQGSTFKIGHSLPFSVVAIPAMDVFLVYVTGQMISTKNPIHRIPGRFVNKTRNSSIRQTLCLSYKFLPLIQISIHGYV